MQIPSAGGASPSSILPPAYRDKAPSSPSGVTEPAPVGGPEKSDADLIAEEKRKVAAYKAERNRVLEQRRKDGWEVPGMQMALPVNAQGYMPYLTADQLKQMDEITDRYIGAPEEKFADLWAELTAMGLHPDQLAKSARLLVDMNGNVVTREQAGKPVNRLA